MADGEEEQFSLCWNNYNTNLSTGFHESLLKGDLVDVTLAAEGHLVKAHRLVLSVCSPYFQKMFTQMPANQHAFVFLKDVPHAALKDLIQFMYCGEVNVKQDALPTFISTAEALQIKGLTENGDSQSVPASQTPSTQTHVPIKATSTPANVVQTQRPRTVQQRNVNRTASYKLDSEDSSDDKATTVVVQQTQKRVLPRAGAPVPTSAKRLKTISADPLEQPETPTRSTVGQSSSVQQGPSAQIVQVTSAADVGKNVGEPEFIDLPIETVPTKAEPDYGDEGEMEEAGDTEATYVEDESYGDMKYDESYFTESEETGKGASASGFGESYTEGDTSANEAQDGFNEFAELIIENGTISLIQDSHKFIRDRVDNDRSYWRCRHSFKYECKARVVTKSVNGYEMMKIRMAEHNHTEIKKPKKGPKKKKGGKSRSKASTVPRLIRPKLTNQAQLRLTPKMPKLTPKTTPKLTPKTENVPPNDDAENMIVDILD
ncbi:modifier of mdg4-like isoform X3 [Sitodiplosis mosellana]|uniref:modifier of mdg4-like isoform X3 n=1 Tax=Sitodiplosis mosellana TaxID=263140 RepID=UPI002443CA2A|nr:modifier of mdg4-like isoform X3 [Sitodiplosis mosellana]